MNSFLTTWLFRDFQAKLDLSVGVNFLSTIIQPSVEVSIYVGVNLSSEQSRKVAPIADYVFIAVTKV